MGEIQIQIPPCSSNYQISKDIDAFLNKQGNYIPIIFHKPKFTGGGVFDYFFTNKSNTTPDSNSNSNSVSNSNSNSNSETTNNEKEKEKEKESINKEDYLVLEFQNKTHTIDNIKGTKLYYLFLRKGECARWI